MPDMFIQTATGPSGKVVVAGGEGDLERLGFLPRVTSVGEPLRTGEAGRPLRPGAGEWCSVPPSRSRPVQLGVVSLSSPALNFSHCSSRSTATLDFSALCLQRVLQCGPRKERDSLFSRLAPWTAGPHSLVLAGPWVPSLPTGSGNQFPRFCGWQ